MSIGGEFSRFGDALRYLVPAVTALVGYFAARYTADAQLRASLNDAFRSLMEEWQTERARLTARNLELEAEVLRQRGEINNHIQVNQSLRHMMERNRHVPPTH